MPHTDDFTANAAEVTRGGVWVGMVEDNLDGFRRGGDSSRGGGDGSRVDSEVKGETQGREGLGGIEDTLLPVYDETGFNLVRASMRTSRMWMACAWERAAPRKSST